VAKGTKAIGHPPRLRIVAKKSESPLAENPDERELWAKECLAKAAYCEFAVGVAVDGGYREWLQKLVAEWKRAAEAGPEEESVPHNS
jgi:hypothetical protein